MQQALTALPMELLLDILEMLLAQGGKANQRSAAYLAQSCRSLRTSKAGKQARYIHALARHSMSVPARFPTNLEYETQVLEQATWPPQPPQQPLQQLSGPAALQDVHAAVLETDGHVSLSKDQRSLHYFAVQPSPSATREACGESSVLLRTIEFRSRVTAWAVNQDRRWCAVAYDIISSEGALEQMLEVWDLVTGARQASFELITPGGVVFDEAVDHITFSAQYLMVSDFPNYVVYSIPDCCSSGSAWPIVWSTDEVHDRLVQIAVLLSPQFIAAITEDEEWREGVIVVSHIRIEFYRLTQTSFRLVAVFSLHAHSPGAAESNLSVRAGAEIAPEEVGVLVVTTLRHAYLLPITTLVDILYSSAEDVSAQTLSFDLDWLDKHASCLSFPTDHTGNCTSASGWKCVLDLDSWRPIDGDETNKLWFVDAFPGHSRSCISHSPLENDLVQPTMHEHGLTMYFPSRALRRPTVA